jgi:hypothetical protein
MLQAFVQIRMMWCHVKQAGLPKRDVFQVSFRNCYAQCEQYAVQPPLLLVNLAHWQCVF